LQSSVERLDDFANKTILSTQLGSGQYNLNLTKINAKELVQYCYLELTNVVMEKHIDFVEQIDPGLVVVGDRDLIYKAFLYILENAVDNAKSDSEIIIVVEKSNDMVKFSITDQGDVIIENPEEFLLNPFQASGGGLNSNFGLSLFLINQIVELHGGKIDMSNKDEGLCVEFYINQFELTESTNE